MNKIKKYFLLRIVLSTVFFALIFFGNWWLVALIGIGILAAFSAWEVVLGAVLMDLLYATSAGFYGFPAVWTTSALFAFFAFRLLRSKLF